MPRPTRAANVERFADETSEDEEADEEACLASSKSTRSKKKQSNKGTINTGKSTKWSCDSTVSYTHLTLPTILLV